MKRVDTTCIQIDVIRIGALRIVVRVLRSLDPKPARHVQEIRDADFRAWIAFALPFWNRRWLPELIDSLLDQDSHQRCGHAFAHRPALEGRARRNTLRVALPD